MSIADGIILHEKIEEYHPTDPGDPTDTYYKSGRRLYGAIRDGRLHLWYTEFGYDPEFDKNDEDWRTDPEAGASATLDELGKLGLVLKEQPE